MEWLPRTRDFLNEKKNLNILKFFSAKDHPLKIENNDLSKSRINFSLEKDIKTSSLINTTWGGLDPLSIALIEKKSKPNINHLFKKNKNEFLDDDIENWEIFSKSSLTKINSYLDNFNRKCILGEDSKNSKIFLTYKNLIHRTNDLKIDLIESWKPDQRIKSLQILQQCCMDLSEVEPLVLYGYKFFVTIEMLESFKKLIYKQIHEKINDENGEEIAKEICKYWKYKILSISNLISRTYLELCTFKIFTIYLNQESTENIITCKRLINTIRGVGDPLIATYLLAYVCKILIEIYSEEKILFSNIFTDLIQRINQIQKNLEYRLEINYIDYVKFFIYPLNWILKCVLYKTSYEFCDKIYQEFITITNQDSDLFLIFFNLMVPKLNKTFFIENSQLLINLIEKLFKLNLNDDSPKFQLIKNLIRIFLNSETDLSRFDKKFKLKFFDKIWKLIKFIKNDKDCIECKNAWLNFALINFNQAEINLILNDIITSVTQNIKNRDNLNEDLIKILDKVLNCQAINYKQFLTSDIFLSFIEMFQEQHDKVLACKTVLEFSIKKIYNEDNKIYYGDADYLAILFYLYRTMHDSIDLLTIDEERKNISRLIELFINSVNFEHNTDELDFLVQCRGIFYNFNNITILLIHKVNLLIYRCTRFEQNLLQLNSFIKACLAYSFITIPSINDLITKFSLYLSSAEVSLNANYYEQTDSFVKHAILTLDKLDFNQITRLEEVLYHSQILKLLSFMVLIPDDPNKDYFFFFKLLFNTLIKLNFRDKNLKINIYLNMLNYLCVMNQIEYPYHYENVQSNDNIYNNEEEYKNTIKQLGQGISEKIFEYLNELADQKDFIRQSNLAFECFYFLINNCEAKSQWKLLFNLWQLAIKNSNSDKTKILESIDYTIQQSVTLNDTYLKGLSIKMQKYLEKKMNIT